MENIEARKELITALEALLELSKLVIKDVTPEEEIILNKAENAIHSLVWGEYLPEPETKLDVKNLKYIGILDND
jgi:alanine-alpha-ketoisovalerate/valine-pyruvate aminotransferase